jgi:hypothetical protein
MDFPIVTYCLLIAALLLLLALSRKIPQNYLYKFVQRDENFKIHQIINIDFKNCIVNFEAYGNKYSVLTGQHDGLIAKDFSANLKLKGSFFLSHHKRVIILEDEENRYIILVGSGAIILDKMPLNADDKI